MPRIIVTAESNSSEQATILLTERIAPSDLESDHFAAQLVERVGWAVLDADELEAAVRDARPSEVRGSVRSSVQT